MSTTEVLVVVFDGFIAGWLVFTWFYEGHHRRCKVDLTCPRCGHDSTVSCTADRRKDDDVHR